jgi:GNAT superfamily N-acetyltransferase
MPECVAVLRRVHEMNGYPSRWPRDPAGWLTPTGLEAAWVAVDDDSIVGQAVLVRGVNTSCLMRATGRDASEFGLVARLYVDPAARRVGRARALLETATSYAVAHGLQPVLDVVADSLAAVALYEGAGWQLVGTEIATWVTPAGIRPTVRWYVGPMVPRAALGKVEKCRLRPPLADGLLGHEGDRADTGLDGQVRPDGLLSGAQLAQRVPATDGQVRNDVIELTLVWSECREGLVGALSKGTEGTGIIRREPEHLVAEPIRALQPEAEPAAIREQPPEPGQHP